MPNIVNEMAVREMQGAVETAEGMLVVGVDGLSMPENEELRDQLADHGVRLRVVRNTLAKLAFEANEVSFPEDIFTGSLAVALGSTEETILAAKVVDKSPLRKAGKLAFRAGVLEGEVLGPQDTQALADVPDQDTVRAMILGAISGPARGLVSVLSGLPSGLARVIQAQADAGGFAGEAAPAAEAPAEEAPAEEAPAEEAPAEEAPAEEAPAEEPAAEASDEEKPADEG